jgi:threonine dehydrogenase-like Zn-dependent dehydrogenase
MRALVARGFGDLILDDIAEPTVGPGKVLVQNKVTAVSAGTERRMLFGRPNDVREHAPEFPVQGAFGYLAAGDIVEVGPDVDGLKVGDRVSAGRAWGAHREILDTDATSVIPVPESMSYMEAAASYWAVPPLAGIFAAKPRIYSDTAVIGLGPLGLCAAQILAHSSRRVLAIDIVETRVELARSFGTVGVNNSTGRVQDAIDAEMPAGPEVVIEASGTQAGLELALEIVAPLGRIALVGVPPPLDGINLFWPMQHKGVQLVPLARESTSSPQGGGAGSPRTSYLPDALDMISRGLLDIDAMTSWIVPVERAAEAFDLLNAHPDKVLGIGFAWEDGQSREVERFDALRAADSK